MLDAKNEFERRDGADAPQGIQIDDELTERIHVALAEK